MDEYPDEDTCNCNPCLCDTPDGMCLCDPCYCETPENSEGGEDGGQRGVDLPELGRGFTLDEFLRAKEFFMVTSKNTGLSVYDHLSEVLRKLLDDRNPPNIVDFMEEISLNIKRYRFGLNKEIVRDAHYISPPLLADAYLMVDSWKQHALWSAENQEVDRDGKPSFGGFPNLLRLLYYLEQVNVGLPREEMFRTAYAIRDLTMTRPVSRSRFFGKIYGIYKNYYVLEVELKGDAPEQAWEAPPTTPPEEIEHWDGKKIEEDPTRSLPGAGETFLKAGGSVMDPEILKPYEETSGLPPGAMSIVPKRLPGGDEFYGEGEQETLYENPDPEGEARWEQYQHELMGDLPLSPIERPVIIPPESKGRGLNRRTFYVCNELGDEWIRLPEVTPEQINSSRSIRWALTGDLNNKLTTFLEFPGREGNYLRALLARITAGGSVSPKGYFKRKYGDEYDGEDDDEESELEEDEEDVEEGGGDDSVRPVRKFRAPPMAKLLNADMSSWVHHARHILRQGRLVWVNPTKPIKSVDEEEEDVEEEEEEEEEDRESGPHLFSSVSEDKTLDGTAPWSTRASSTVFTEFQVASARSNLWPGATTICTIKGKVEQIYFGDGLKFMPTMYAPPVPEEPQLEYVVGPELNEIKDPTVKEEENWLNKLQLDEIADVEEKFVDNEIVEEEEESEDED